MQAQCFQAAGTWVVTGINAPASESSNTSPPTASSSRIEVPRERNHPCPKTRPTNTSRSRKSTLPTHRMKTGFDKLRICLKLVPRSQRDQPQTGIRHRLLGQRVPRHRRAAPRSSGSPDSLLAGVKAIRTHGTHVAKVRAALKS